MISSFGGSHISSLACIAHGFGKRGLTLSQPLTKQITQKLGRGSDPFSRTRAQCRLEDVVDPSLSNPK